MSKDWSGGSTRRWRKIRLVILKRDSYVCQLQIDGVCKYRADSVHHTKGKAFGDDMRYLVAACMPCNQHVGDPNSDHGTVTDPEPRPSSLLD
jgi:5-methylcytosine-specific restriction endonuclease McrA